jgi:hypothetical protein
LVCAHAVIRRTTPAPPGWSDRMIACHSAPARGAVTSRVRSALSRGQTGCPGPTGVTARVTPDTGRIQTGRPADHRASRAPASRARSCTSVPQPGRSCSLWADGGLVSVPSSIASSRGKRPDRALRLRGCPDTCASSPRTVPRTGVDNPVDGTADIGV